jgi:hypothetical protein
MCFTFDVYTKSVLDHFSFIFFHVFVVMIDVVFVF